MSKSFNSAFLRIQRNIEQKSRPPKKYRQRYRIIAERALGKPLALKHPVHHVDRNRRNNANTNLVICEDAAYHWLLHVRQRVLDAGGDPNTQRICGNCHLLKNFKEMNGENECKKCHNERWNANRRKRKARVTN